MKLRLRVPKRFALAKLGARLIEAGEDHVKAYHVVALTFIVIALPVCSVAIGSIVPALLTIPAAIVIAFPLVVLIMGNLLYPNCIIDGREYGGEEYAAIADELRLRGISNVKRFIAQHPDHERHRDDLRRSLDYRITGHGDEVYSFTALIYSDERDPLTAKEAILHIVNERGISDLDEIRRLRSVVARVESPLGAGAL